MSSNRAVIKLMSREQRQTLLRNAGWRWVTASIWRHPLSECPYPAHAASHCGHAWNEYGALLRVLGGVDQPDAEDVSDTNAIDAASVEVAEGGRASKRDRIRQALLHEPTLSHNAIAKRLGGVHPKQVDRACAELIRHSRISECGHRFTEDGKMAPGRKPNKQTA